VGRPFDGMAGSGAGIRTADRAGTGGSPCGAECGRPASGLLPGPAAGAARRDVDPVAPAVLHVSVRDLPGSFVELMAAEPRIVPYLDMPIQHGSDAVLKRMRRPERQATIRERVAWLRDAVPGRRAAHHGHRRVPGETDEEFDGHARAARGDAVRPSRRVLLLGLRRTTPAARMDGQVPGRREAGAARAAARPAAVHRAGCAMRNGSAGTSRCWSIRIDRSGTSRTVAADGGARGGGPDACGRHSRSTASCTSTTPGRPPRPVRRTRGWLGGGERHESGVTVPMRLRSVRSRERAAVRAGACADTRRRELAGAGVRPGRGASRSSSIARHGAQLL
jgi:hypothetical protein